MPAGFNIVVSATDKATETLRRVNQQMENLEPASQRFSRELASLSRVTGLQDVSKGLRAVARSSTDAFLSISRVASPLAAITGVGVIAGIGRMVQAWQKSTVSMGQAASRLDMPVGQLDALGGAAEIAGSSADALQSSLVGLQKTLFTVKGGGNGDAAALLNAWGISAASSAAEALPKIADHIRGLNGAAKQTALGTLGMSSDLLPLLNQGSGGIAALTAQAESYGTRSDEMVQHANELREAEADLGRQIHHTTDLISEDFAKAITPVLGDMSAWIAKNHEWIETDIGKAIGGAAAGVDTLVRSLGGWERVSEGLLAMWTAPRALKALSVFEALFGASAVPLASTLALSGDTPGAPSPDAITPDQAQSRATEINAGEGYTGEFWHDLGVGVEHALGLRSGNNGVPHPGATFGPPTAQQQQTARAMAQQLTDAGLSREGVAALLGAGADAESSFNPQATNAGHAGLFQWDNARAWRITQHFGKAVGQMSAAEQTAAAAWELQNYYPKTWDALHGNDLSAASAAVTTDFERPGNYDTEVPARLARSERNLSFAPAAKVQALQTGNAGPDGASGQVHVHVSADDGLNVKAGSQGDVIVKTGSVFTAMPLAALP